MTDDAITKVKILKFVRLLDGGENEATVIEQAINRNWLDQLGSPTRDGRQLVSSFDKMHRSVEPEI
ncbi:MAG: hypothetical protein HXY23_13385 [Parvularculaceae bacterium]|jgi:hypothetical protein|nr:hypothetical protein [Parvularculaceae bacterium]